MNLDFMMIDGAPKPVAPFSHAVTANGFVFVTGQMPTDPVTDELVGADIKAQSAQVMANLEIVLAGAGTRMERVTHARAYLTHFERDYAAFNAFWASYFPQGQRPARTTVGVTALAVGALVEVDLIALL